MSVLGEVRGLLWTLAGRIDVRKGSITAWRGWQTTGVVDTWTLSTRCVANWPQAFMETSLTNTKWREKAILIGFSRRWYTYWMLQISRFVTLVPHEPRDAYTISHLYIYRIEWVYHFLKNIIYRDSNSFLLCSLQVRLWRELRLSGWTTLLVSFHFFVSFQGDVYFILVSHPPPVSFGIWNNKFFLLTGRIPFRVLQKTRYVVQELPR